MARHTLPHEIIASRGVKLDLTGQDVTLVYSFAALAAVETEFDSVSGALSALTSIRHQGTSTARLLACGLQHEVDSDGAPLSDVENLMPLLDSNRVGTYHEAIMEALANAVPAVRDALDAQAAEEAAAGDAVDPTSGSLHRSPGNTGTTSPQSSSDAQTPSSGT